LVEMGGVSHELLLPTQSLAWNHLPPDLHLLRSSDCRSTWPHDSRALL
jgi:hypothetical protein